ncbi:MAG: hypothetical protein PHW56_05650 [Methanosarcinaceae archaeon]|nr:hypothetical protein [Methanosarcinaceae archaeon]
MTIGKTQDIIEQNKKNIKLTSNAQNMSLIHKKLEEFYYPLYDFLKAYVCIKEEKQKNCKEIVKSICINLNVKDFEQRDLASFNKIINHQYLADNKTKGIFNKFTQKLYESASSTDFELIKIHEALIVSLENNIGELNNQLEFLESESDSKNIHVIH